VAREGEKGGRRIFCAGEHKPEWGSQAALFRVRTLTEGGGRKITGEGTKILSNGIRRHLSSADIIRGVDVHRNLSSIET